MSGLDELLRSALRREEAPAGFAQRVIARTERERRGGGWRSWAAGCVAASLLLGPIGVQQMEERRERERGRAAEAQLRLALQIASSKLQRIHRKLDGLNHE